MPRKGSAKDLKQPDKLQTAFINFMQILSENRQKVYLASAVIGVAILLTGGYYVFHLNYEKKATLMFDKVFNTQMISSQSQTKETEFEPLDVFKEVTTQYPKSQAAKLAYYRMGNIFFDRGDFDAAITSYEKFLSKTSRDNELKTLTYTGLGYCYEEKKDYDNALSSFEKALKSKEGIRFAGMINRNIARIYEKMKNNAKAVDHYKEAINHTTDPSVQLLLKRKIATLS